MLRRRPVRVLVALSGVVLVTYVGYRVIPVNATTVGFAYLLLILIVASTSGFLEAALSSFLATLLFNFFFLPPVGTFTVADPQNWVALFSFLATSLIASRLSTKAKTRASEAIERQRDLERLYAFSRAMLLIDRSAPFAKQLVEKLAEIFNLEAAVLYERHTGEFYCFGISGPEGFEDDLRLAALPDGPSTKSASPVRDRRRPSRLGAGRKYGLAWRYHAGLGFAGCREPGRDRPRTGTSPRSSPAGRSCAAE